MEIGGLNRGLMDINKPLTAILVTLILISYIPIPVYTSSDEKLEREHVTYKLVIENYPPENKTPENDSGEEQAVDNDPEEEKDDYENDTSENETQKEGSGKSEENQPENDSSGSEDDLEEDQETDDEDNKIIENYYPENNPKENTDEERIVDNQPEEGKDNSRNRNNRALISGKTEPLAPVSVIVNSNARTFDLNADENGNFQVEVIGLGEGPHSLKIIAGDGNRNGLLDGPDLGGWNGFGEEKVEDELLAGAHQHYKIPLEFDPFEIQFSEDSGILQEELQENSRTLIERTPENILDIKYKHHDQIIEDLLHAKRLAEEVDGTIEKQDKVKEAWIVSWKENHENNFEYEENLNSLLSKLEQDPSVRDVEVDRETIKEYLVEWIETKEFEHFEWFSNKLSKSEIEEKGMELVSTRGELDYLISYQQMENKLEWSENPEHPGEILDTENEYLIEWKVTKSDWFETPNAIDGDILETRSEVVDQDYIYDRYVMRNITDTEYQIEWTESEKEYLIEWETGGVERNWFDSPEDHKGEVIDNKKTQTDTKYIYDSHPDDPDVGQVLELDEYQGSSYKPSPNSWTYHYIESKPVYETEYLIEWSISDTNAEWFDSPNAHEGEVIDTRIDKTTRVGWFSSPNEKNGKVIDTRTSIVDREWVREGSQTFDTHQGESFQPNSNVKYELRRTRDKKKTRYLIEWTETISDWFESPDDHVGRVIDSRPKRYLYSWTEKNNETRWFDEPEDVPGEILKIVDTEQTSTEEWGYRWTTEETETHREWLDSNNQDGNVIQTRETEEFGLKWTSLENEAFGMDRREDAYRFLADLHDRKNAYNITIDRGQAPLLENYLVSWKVPQSVKRRYLERYRIDYLPLSPKSKSTSFEVASRNNYSGKVNLNTKGSEEVLKKITRENIELNSSEMVDLSITPKSITNSTHPVTVSGKTPDERGGDSDTYMLFLETEADISNTRTKEVEVWEDLNDKTSLIVTALRQVSRNGSLAYEQMDAEIKVDGEKWTNSGNENRSVDPGYHEVSFGNVDGYKTPTSKEVYMVSGESQIITGLYKKKESHLLNIKLNPEDGGKTSPSSGMHRYHYGDRVEIEADEEPGWEFEKWTGDRKRDLSSTHLYITRDKEVTAHFNPKLSIFCKGPGSLRIIEPKGNSVQIEKKTNETYGYGSKVKIEAKSEGNGEFKGWEGHIGEIDKKDHSLEVEMDKPRTITANFEERKEQKKNRGENRSGTPRFIAYVMVNKSVPPEEYKDLETFDENHQIREGYIRYAPFQGFYLMDKNHDGVRDSIVYIDGLAHLEAENGYTRFSQFNLKPKNLKNDSWGYFLNNEPISEKREFLEAPKSMGDEEVDSLWWTIAEAGQNASWLNDDEDKAFFPGYHQIIEDIEGYLPYDPEDNLGMNALYCGSETTAHLFEANGPTGSNVVGPNEHTMEAWRDLWIKANESLSQGDSY